MQPDASPDVESIAECVFQAWMLHEHGNWKLGVHLGFGDGERFVRTRLWPRGIGTF
jgi:hypothetical protein